MRLPPDPLSVRTARGLVSDELERAGCADLVPDAALLVTELVCNAVMHARTAILLHVTVTEQRVRVEVDDGSEQLPRWAPSAVDAIQGRGLTLVDALASSWGSDPLASGGKTVWFELSHATPPPAESSPAELLEQWARLDENNDAEELAEVVGTEIVLPDVRPELLLAVCDHCENVVREHQLLLLDEGARVSDVARRLVDVAEQFAGGRRQLRAAALSAYAQGEPQITVRLRLAAADLGAPERYRDALEQAEGQNVADTMLIAPSTPAIRQHRAWLLTEIARQLRGRPGDAGG